MDGSKHGEGVSGKRWAELAVSCGFRPQQHLVGGLACSGANRMQSQLYPRHYGQHRMVAVLTL